MIDLNILNDAVQKMNEGLAQEREKAERLARELAALKQVRVAENSAAQTNFQKLRTQDDAQKKQIVAYYQRLEATTALARKLQTELDSARVQIEESDRRFAMAKTTLEAGLKHSEQVARGRERELMQLSARLNASEKNHAELRTQAREREERLRIAIEEREFQKRALAEELDRIKDSYLRAQADASRGEGMADEISRLRHEAAREAKRADMAENRARDLEQKSQALRERLIAHQQSNSEESSVAVTAEREKQMLLSCLRATEAKLAAAETRNAYPPTRDADWGVASDIGDSALIGYPIDGPIHGLKGTS